SSVAAAGWQSSPAARVALQPRSSDATPLALTPRSRLPRTPMPTMSTAPSCIEPVNPALAKVTIFEVAERPWGWLMTSAEVDDRVYIGSREWRRPVECRAGGIQ